MEPSPRAAPAPNAVRAEQVRATRQKVLAAARDLFVRRGCSGSTIEAVAKRAAVSPQTVHNVIGGRAALLKAVYDVALAGDDEPVPMGERPLVAEMADAPDARSCPAAYARLGRQIFVRVGPVVTVVVVEGPGRDRDLRAFVETVEEEGRRGTAAVAHHIAGPFGLRPGLTEAEAADVLWTLTAPEVADRFVRRRGWSTDRYEQWLAQAMTDALVGPEPRTDR